jgi:uncharacterized RDD family membrane protein YckC
VIQTCEKCGAINQSGAENCTFCHARLVSSAEPSEVSVAAREPSAKSDLTQPQDWRSEVSHRIKSYRERKRKSPINLQTSLLFSLQANEPQNAEQQNNEQQSNAQLSEEQLQQAPHQDLDDTVDEPLAAPGVLDDDQYEDPLQATLAAAASRMQLEAPPHTIAQPAIEPQVAQPLLIDVSAPPAVDADAAQESSIDENVRLDEYAGAGEIYDSQLFPVAQLSLRRRAGAVDAVCLSLAFASVVALYTGFGGSLAIGRLDLIVGGTILALLYTQYFTLFTMMGGATPGMMLMGLRLVSFDGSAPAPAQLMWRSFGYLISGATALVGFLWAFWDEDHLSWHDRISRTYITSMDITTEAHASANQS